MTSEKKRDVSLLLFDDCDGDDLIRDVVQSLNVPDGLAGCAISCISALVCVGTLAEVNANTLQSTDMDRGMARALGVRGRDRQQ